MPPTKLAEKLNYLTAKNIVGAIGDTKSTMIFMSSSYVFDGKEGNYSEEDEINPNNEYGRTKIKAEREVLKLSDSINPIVLRMDIMYGYNGKKENNGVFDRVLSGNKIKVGNPNQIRQPLFVDDLAEIIVKLIEKKQSGIFHVAGPTRIKTIDFIRKLEALVRKESKISVIREKELLVKPLKNSTLNISKITSLGIKTSSLDKGLETIRKQLLIHPLY